MFLIWSLAPSKKPDSRHCPQTVSHVLVTNVLIPYWDATPSANPLHPWTRGHIVENPWSSADPTLTFAPSVGCDMHQPPAFDPVNEHVPSNPFSHPPSKCWDCKLVSRHITTTVLDGTQYIANRHNTNQWITWHYNYLPIRETLSAESFGLLGWCLKFEPKYPR